MSYFTQVSYSDTGSLDAFSRLRVSSPENLFSTQCQYDADPLQLETGVTGTGVAPAHNASTRMVALSATAGTGTSFIQSYQYSPYQPGRSQFIACTGVLGAGVVGAAVDFGYFDTNNGIIFRQNGATNLQLILRTSTGGSVSDANIVAQNAWNIDRMDGTGASGITLDITKALILIIDLQFLGMGRVRVGFDINGVVYYVHQFLNANNLTVPYMQTANLPVQMLLTATATAGTKTCYFKCATVQSEGGALSGFGYNFSTPDASVTAANAARTHLISLRPRTTFNGLTNRSMLIVEELNLFVTGNMDVLWELCVGATFSVAPTFANVNATNSAFEYGTGGTFSALTSGVVISSGYVSRLGGTNNGTPIQLPFLGSTQYPITLDRAGAVRSMGTLTLLVQGLSQTSAMRGSIEYREVR